MTVSRPAAPTNRRYLAGRRLRVTHHGRMLLGRIRSVHRMQHGIEYVVRSEDADGAMGDTVTVLTTWARSACRVPARLGGEAR